jgi:hypothetical protein
MIYIAHRGNTNGPDPDNENKPEYLLKAIENGFYIETDLWVDENEKLFLGHDCPQYEIKIDFLLQIKDRLFCHCKNIKALHFIIKKYPEIECFFHDNEECVLTSKQHIWNYPGTELTTLSICVNLEDNKECYINKNIFGVCSDFL